MSKDLGFLVTKFYTDTDSSDVMAVKTKKEALEVAKEWQKDTEYGEGITMKTVTDDRTICISKVTNEWTRVGKVSITWAEQDE